LIELNDLNESKKPTKTFQFNKKDFFAPKPKNALGEPLISGETNSGEPSEPVSKI
jgi:hypothetical protein